MSEQLRNAEVLSVPSAVVGLITDIVLLVISIVAVVGL